MHNLYFAILSCSSFLLNTSSTECSCFMCGEHIWRKRYRSVNVKSCKKILKPKITGLCRPVVTTHLGRGYARLLLFWYK